MLSVFLSCDLQNKSSLYKPRQIKLKKNRAVSQAGGLWLGLQQPEGRNCVLLLQSHHADLTLCFQGVYHQGLRRLKGPGNTSRCCTCDRAHDREATQLPLLPPSSSPSSLSPLHPVLILKITRGRAFCLFN